MVFLVDVKDQEIDKPDRFVLFVMMPVVFDNVRQADGKFSNARVGKDPNDQ